MNILVTGASSGVGFETALSLCKKGHYVIAVSRNGKGLEELERKLRTIGHPDKLSLIQADITKEDDLLKLKYHVGKMHAHLDVLINNAGQLINKPFEEINGEELRLMYQVNVFAPFRLIQLMMSLLGGNEFSHIVNISSMGGIQGSVKFSGLSAYSSSKAALIGLTELLAEEFKNKNIHVNAIALGAVKTDMLRKAFPDFAGGRKASEVGEWIAEFVVGSGCLMNGKTIQLSDSTP